MLTFMTPGAGTIQPLNPGTHGAWTRRLRNAGYLIEPWRCDIGSGSIVLGLRTLALLGLRANPCGIADLLRACDEDDRPTILDILDEATAMSSSFCFSATVRRPKALPAQLCCIGNSTFGEDGDEGSLHGVFAAARPTLLA